MRRIRKRPHPALAGLGILALSGVYGCGLLDGGQSSEPPAKDPVTATPAGSTKKPKPTSTPTPTPSASPSNSANKALDPCALVPKKDAERLAGTPLNKGQAIREMCTYTGPVSGPTAQVEIYVGDGAKKYLDVERQLGHKIRRLPGVADEAYAEDEAVFVRKSTQWAAVHLVRLNDPKENRQALEDMARKVAGRI